MNDVVRFNAPFNKEVKLEPIVYENGFPMLKVTIRERSRFTTMELDHDTALQWGQLLIDWAQAHNPHTTEG